MWTPRRVLLLFGGVLLFAGAYGFYARFLGWLDGRPPLPAKMLGSSPSTHQLPPRTTSPTIERIREAFGPDCMEQQSTYYPTQLEFRNGETSTVLASGSPPFNTGSNRIVLSPFSVATFGAPKPKHLLEKGEVTEISTFHADKAVLEFDRPVNGPGDMAKAKLIRMELVSEPDPARLKLDRRCGVVHITNNQRSADPSKFLVIRTVGPMFYRDPKSLDPKTSLGASTGPDIWTDAAVEIVDRQNLPLRQPAASANRYRIFSLADEAETALAKGSDLQTPAAVAEILEGRRLPPPTVTAIGLKIFLEPPNQPTAKAPPKTGSNPLSGVRRVELLEKVLVNLWIDSQQTLLSTTTPAKPVAPTGKSGAPSVAPPPRYEPPVGAGAIAGGLFHSVEAVRRLDRALLQVDTLGRLTYETEKSTARFDVLPDGNLDLPNDVQVFRVPPLGAGTQRLFSQFLEIEFVGAPVGTPTPKPADVPAKPAEATAGASFKRVRAWVEMPGRIVTIISEPDRLEAYGQSLLHDKETQTTTLYGAPIYAVRRNEPRADGKPAGGNILNAGSKERPATLTLKPGPGPEKPTTAMVDGPGRFELFDAVANANTVQASWQTRMTTTKEFVSNRELDLFTFVDDAMFEDKRAEYWLKGKELKLWMEPKGESAAGSSQSSGGSLPHRLQALGDVTSHSADFDIEQADALNVMFRDGLPPLVASVEPKSPALAPLPMPMGPRLPKGPVVAAPPVPPPPPPKPKPPMKLKARSIDTWIVRYPMPPEPKTLVAKKVEEKPEAAPATGSLKYELEKARCEGRVEVHQDPAEPGPDKRGVDIRGQVLLVDQTPDGSVMTVTGADDRHPGEVHHEGMSIVGSKIVINQLNNTADVEGRGSLRLPSNTNLNGGDLKQASVVVVHWRDRMKFQGAIKLAEFFGKVTAQQNDSWVTCHEMQVQFDRPVDFSQRRKNVPPALRPAVAGNPPAQENPKIDSVRCYPAADDLRDEPLDAFRVMYHETVRDETNRIVRSQHMVARELEMNARVFEAGRKDPFQRVIATGPGTVRLWQSGLKDEAGPKGAAAPAPMNQPKESEMKLTIVQFAGRMTACDYGSVYQEATFVQRIDLLHCPADRDDAAIDHANVPPGSVTLQCVEKLIVSSHKKPNAPTSQRLDASGNAYIRSDEYDGWGETVTSDGPTVTLKGGETTQARIKKRFNADGTSAKKIVYNRLTGEYSTTESSGSTIQQGPKR